jgi:hypothetical protein
MNAGLDDVATARWSTPFAEGLPKRMAAAAAAAAGRGRHVFWRTSGERTVCSAAAWRIGDGRDVIAALVRASDAALAAAMQRQCVPVVHLQGVENDFCGCTERYEQGAYECDGDSPRVQGFRDEVHPNARLAQALARAVMLEVCRRAL